VESLLFMHSSGEVIACLLRSLLLLLLLLLLRHC
jgi:hypothetical protein